MTKHYNALELNKVLRMLSEYTSCEDSTIAALAITPFTNYNDVVRQMENTADIHRLTDSFGTPTIYKLKNCSNSLARAKLGSILSMRELLDIANILRTTRSLVAWKVSCSNQETSLDYTFTQLFPNKSLEQTISSAIISEDEMSDSASPELGDIRRKIRNSQLKARSQLDRLIKSTAGQKFLQEQIVTLRDGRFVVPVKAEYKNEVKGLVHDTSSSGATFFIEPIAVVEANNEIRILEGKEKDEIERILAQLSEMVATDSDLISDSYNTIIELDVLFAKSKLADKMRASVPIISDEGKTVLKKARHPLIKASDIVPIDIEIGDKFDTLVITGPNTGGKTVALKTVGLLTLMAMCGLMLPVFDGSIVHVYNQVLADIGDEQSIEQSLSTFSSHMTNIVSILKSADNNTLVLIDELGAGTDPVEGAALAVAIIEKLRILGANIVATTHYPEIKMFALQTPKVENACCEFDVASLRPTYRLLIGIPGRSNAFAISERLGLDIDIIDSAKEYVSKENTRFEDVVTELQSTKQEIDKEQALVRSLRIQTEAMKNEADAFRERLEQAKEKELERARMQSRSILEKVKKESEELLNELEEIKRQKSAEEFGELVSKGRSSFRVNMKKLEDLSDPVTRKNSSSYTLPRALKRGDLVMLANTRTEGIVLTPADNNGYVLIQAGIMRTKVLQNELKLLDPKKKNTLNGQVLVTKSVTSKVDRQAKTEVNLCGMTSEEAEMELTQYIDNSVMAGLKILTVIHGRGVLRKVVHQKLKNHRHVKTFRLGVYGEGEDGVTIVELV